MFNNQKNNGNAIQIFMLFIDRIIDYDPKEAYKYIDGFFLRGVDDIFFFESDGIILISQLYYAEMYQQLCELGYLGEKVFW